VRGAGKGIVSYIHNQVSEAPLIVIVILSRIHGITSSNPEELAESPTIVFLTERHSQNNVSETVYRCPRGGRGSLAEGVSNVYTVQLRMRLSILVMQPMTDLIDLIDLLSIGVRKPCWKIFSDVPVHVYRIAYGGTDDSAVNKLEGMTRVDDVDHN
jgi:hypothetical protein